jgi:hypothetical protein
MTPTFHAPGTPPATPAREGNASPLQTAPGGDVAAGGSFPRPKNIGPWSEEDKAALKIDWAAGILSRKQIAEKYGRSISGCERQAMSQRVRRSLKQKPPGKAPDKPKVVVIPRNCLRCSAAFQAETRFLRLCPLCRRSDSAGMI